MTEPNIWNSSSLVYVFHGSLFAVQGCEELEVYQLQQHPSMGRLSGDGDVDEDDGHNDNGPYVMMMMLLLLMTTMM